MNSRSLLLMLVGILYAIGAARAQAIELLLKQYDTKVPQEKIHIHFDNNLYTPGQTIWYKAYLLKGNEPSDLSKNLYIDWFDEKGKFVDRLIGPIVGSTASGSFTVPAKYSGTQLQVLAYTKWMLNFDSAFLFHKTIPVLQLTGTSNTQAAIPVTTLRFFPEGGDLVENIPSILAYKAQNQGGMPTDVSGIITDKNGNQVTTFASVHDGMGKFIFTPLPGENYTAEWIDASGGKRYTSLPTAKPTGVVLSVNTDLINPRFSIERSTTGNTGFTSGTIVAQMNQRIVFRAGVDLSANTKIKSSIPVKDLPTGILQVTLFDAMHKPLAERILFVNNDNYRMKVNLYTDTVNFTKRGKNVFELDVPDSIKTSMSVVVTDAGMQPDSTNNIISQLLLSGEVKGYVHNPAYYFLPFLDSTEEHLDLVMLTNGWRRFKWEDVWAGKTPSLPYQADTSYLSITGRIDNLAERRIEKAEMMNLILLSKDSSTRYIFTPLHADGTFSERNVIFFDTAKMFYKVNRVGLQAKGKITIKTSFLPFDSTKMIPSFRLLLNDTGRFSRMQFFAQEQRLLDSLKNKTTLQEVVVKAKFKTRLEQLDEKYAKGNFSGHSRAIYELNVVDDTLGNTHMTMIEYLRDKLTGFRVAMARTHTVANYGFILDGETPISFDEVNRMPVGMIAYIKAWPAGVLVPPNIWPSKVIAIYTKKGKDAYINSDFADLSSIRMAGYSPMREFYSPDYGEDAINNTKPDFRQTIYWNPNILTGRKDQKIRVAFYNNDISHSFRVVLEGITADGKLIHINKLLK
ncbi:MAG: hypothetical protein V4557_05720 [Bacteroidota bacterium]